MALSLPVKVMVLLWKLHGNKEATIMKRITNIRTLATLLMASAAIVSCSVKEDIFEEETTIKEEPAKVYTLSVNATKGGDDEATKALSLDGKTLNAAWAQNEEVTVYNNTKKVQFDGTLKAQSDGSSTTLKGSLTGTIENGDKLILRFNSGNYASQSGTLDYIAANCDFAEASITVSSVDGENNVIPTSKASFVNQQAIVKFILKDQDNKDLNVSNLTISAGSNRLVSASGYRGSGTKTYHTGYTVDRGTGNTNVNGGYDQILDGNTATKWCVDTKTKSGGVWFVEFHTASAVQVDGYKLTTADDTQTYSERNPKNWTLKAKVNSGDAWTVIDTKTGNTDMPAANCSSVDFETDVQGMYQYFRLEVSTVQSGGWFQLSEMQLYGCSDREFSFRYGNVNVTPAAATNELTVALNNQSGASDTYTLTSIDGSYKYTFTKSGVTFERGKYYAITVKMTKAASVPEGAINGKFSVASGKQVYFSKGNLQYQASSNTWRFAEHQYDFVGDATTGNVSVGSDKSNNASISSSYTGWIDLFGWGTSGKSFASGYGSSYHPWSKSTTSSSAYGPNGTNNLTGTYANGDWGVNMDGGWRTLSKAEWVYLFNTRTVNGGTGSGKSYTRGKKVNNVLGVVLYPDDYTGAAYTTGANWSTFESAGCVFLPAAGWRGGKEVKSVGSYGAYWSSTAYGTDYAYLVYFYSESVSPDGYNGRSSGYSVRLVRPVE